jgi:hypothetical protein
MNAEYARKLAANEALAREVNERVGEVAASWYADQEPLEFVCECARQDCTERVHLRMDEYRAVRSDPHRFAVVPAHVVEKIERVIGPAGDCVVVEKVGVGSEVADETAT